MRQHPERYATLFGRARSEVGHAVCLCRTDQVVRLVIRCRAERYHLANWPAGGQQHAPGCPWYRSPSLMSGRSAYDEAITSGNEGISIRLSTPLTVRGATAAPADVPAAPAAAAGSVSTARRSMGLLALLHFLWESAQLNVWHPREGRRSWRGCRALLDEQARDCRVNRLDLADALWVVPAFQREQAEQINAAWERYVGRLTNSRRVRRRGLVLGELRAVEPTDYGVRIRLAQQRAPLFASAQLMDRARRSYPSAFSEQATQAGRRQVVLCLVERSRRGYPTVVDLAAMLTTGSYLPADSSHEAKMADALTAAERAFHKPLHYDGTEVFPDFVLVDVDPETYIEVWGVRGRESYEARKRAKQAFYRESGRTLLEWDVRDPLPALTRG
ncbi:DUF1173 family protein [Amycolatopsis magusensis]|uniref:DUF1173 family protein n=1 Tax=Amycolatopsis magusensis TaxID=882444 RepID=UPI003798B053